MGFSAQSRAQLRGQPCPPATLHRPTPSSRRSARRCPSRCMSSRLHSAPSRPTAGPIRGQIATDQRPPLSSTAFVHIRQDAAITKLGSKGVRREVLSQENLARAAGEIHNAAPADIPARLPEKTAVELSVGDVPGAVSIAIRYASENPPAAVQWVNALADSYRRTYRQQWRAVGKRSIRTPRRRHRGGWATSPGHRPAGRLRQRAVEAGAANGTTKIEAATVAPPPPARPEWSIIPSGWR